MSAPTHISSAYDASEGAALKQAEAERILAEMAATEEAPRLLLVQPPNEIELAALKEAFRGIPKFVARFGEEGQDGYFVYTLLPKDRHDRILASGARLTGNRTEEQLDAYYREQVLLATVLWPREFSVTALNLMPAGVEYTLFNKAMTASGMNAPAYTEEELEPMEAMTPPTEEQITQLKADPRHKRLGLVYRQIFSVVANSDGTVNSRAVGHFIYTAIERLAYNQLIVDPERNEQKLLDICTVFPKGFDWGSAPTGWARIIANGILELSGFSNAQVQDERLV